MLWKYSCIELYVYKCEEVTPLNEEKVLCHKKMATGLLELTWFMLRGQFMISKSKLCFNDVLV